MDITTIPDPDDEPPSVRLARREFRQDGLPFDERLLGPDYELLLPYALGNKEVAPKDLVSFIDANRPQLEERRRAYEKAVQRARVYDEDEDVAPRRSTDSKPKPSSKLRDDGTEDEPIPLDNYWSWLVDDTPKPKPFSKQRKPKPRKLKEADWRTLPVELSHVQEQTVAHWLDLQSTLWLRLTEINDQSKDTRDLYLDQRELAAHLKHIDHGMPTESAQYVVYRLVKAFIAQTKVMPRQLHNAVYFSRPRFRTDLYADGRFLYSGNVHLTILGVVRLNLVDTPKLQALLYGSEFRPKGALLIRSDDRGWLLKLSFARLKQPLHPPMSPSPEAVLDATREIIAGRHQIITSALLAALAECGITLTSKSLAVRLRYFGIEPKYLSVGGGGQLRGYLAEDIHSVLANEAYRQQFEFIDDGENDDMPDLDDE